MRTVPVAVLVLLAACAAPPPPVEPIEVTTHNALRDYFDAPDAGVRARALEKLDALPVPADPAERIRLLRGALERPARRADSRYEDHANFIATPRDAYDPAGRYPTVVSLAAYAANGRASLTAFAFPREEAEAIAPVSSDWCHEPWRPAPVPNIPWADGIVIAPVVSDMVEHDPRTYAVARRRILDALARANRDFAVDPDRVVVAGFSLGAAIAYDVASRHPDRFAAVADVSGGCPPHPTPLGNLGTLRVYVFHGDEDDLVPVSVSHEIHDELARLNVLHALDVARGHPHELPRSLSEGNRVGRWLRKQRRDAWPRELDLIFAPSREPGYRIYWLEVPPSNQIRKMIARVNGNVVELGPQVGLRKLTLYLGEPLLDLDQEVVVRFGPKELFRGKVERRWRNVVEDLERDGWDVTRAAPAKLDIELR